MNKAVEATATAAPHFDDMQCKKSGCLKFSIAALVVCVIAGTWTWNWMNTWGYRKALPSSAKEIKEWFQEDGFLPDYEYLLRAKISREEFFEYVDELGMTAHSEDRIYDEMDLWLNWSPSPFFEGDWWNPGDSLEDTFVSQSGQSWSYAKYVDGYIYVKGLNH